MPVSRERIIQLAQNAINNHDDKDFGRTVARLTVIAGLALAEGHTSEMYVMRATVEEAHSLAEELLADESKG